MYIEFVEILKFTYAEVEISTECTFGSATFCFFYLIFNFFGVNKSSLPSQAFSTDCCHLKF